MKQDQTGAQDAVLAKKKKKNAFFQNTEQKNVWPQTVGSFTLLTVAGVQAGEPKRETNTGEAADAADELAALAVAQATLTDERATRVC